MPNYSKLCSYLLLQFLKLAVKVADIKFYRFHKVYFIAYLDNLFLNFRHPVLILTPTRLSFLPE